ncbi:hypothetical protein ACLKA7_009488 [Drosophila subpalustris]
MALSAQINILNEIDSDKDKDRMATKSVKGYCGTGARDALIFALTLARSFKLSKLELEPEPGADQELGVATMRTACGPPDMSEVSSLHGT